MKTLILATKNPGKVREFQALLGPLGYEVVTAAQAGYHGDPEETGSTFRANAEIKARAVFEGTGGKHAVLSDDSGLSVDALGGAPGVWSARYAGPDATDADNNAKLLRALREVADPAQRTARYQIALCLMEPGQDPVFIEADCEGVIGHEERGTGGFGYDTLFHPVIPIPGLQNVPTFAEMSAEAKHPLSHRGKAVRALVKFLSGR
jgi:XTP/dITP diphosphohydrolase